MPKEPMIFYPYNYCLNCKTNSIELYSWHNYAQKYQNLLDYSKLHGSLPAIMDKYGVYTMRCSRCGKEYKIVWDEDGIPRPIINEFDYILFMSKFKYDGTRGKPKIIDNIYLEELEDEEIE